MLPLAEDGQRPVPSMIVNPAMESVLLAPEADGRWRLQDHHAFTAAGLVRPGSALQLGKPARGARARLPAAEVAITLTVPPHETYACGLLAQDEPFRREISAQGGIMLMVSHMIDPAADGLALHLAQAMQQRRVLAGWAALDTPDKS